MAVLSQSRPFPSQAGPVSSVRFQPLTATFLANGEGFLKGAVAADRVDAHEICYAIACLINLLDGLMLVHPYKNQCVVPISVLFVASHLYQKLPDCPRRSALVVSFW
ncbi:hypothetical protein FGO68_gene11092 [Halteria grandinella]|uniref:Uncharacterized protein n=1 Tax=Halteria grandinella TaxID=5974 RepID=A0A8J8N9S7_HALGN|nr:hypothetical protein FGO68_gene11092 [Halteria grandinella]